MEVIVGISEKSKQRFDMFAAIVSCICVFLGFLFEIGYGLVLILFFGVYLGLKIIFWIIIEFLLDETK